MDTRELKLRARTPKQFVDLNSVAIGTIATVWKPKGDATILFMGGYISVDVACSVLFEDNRAGKNRFVFRTPVLVPNTPHAFGLSNGIYLSDVRNALKATGSVPASITGTLYGREE